MIVLRAIGIVCAVCLLWSCVPQAAKPSRDMQRETELHYQMGITCLSQGKTADAVKELLEAQSMAPDNPDVEHALGLAYQQKGLNDKAIEQYHKALTLDPKLTEGRNNLGTAYLAQGKLDQAAAEFLECLKDPLYGTPEKAAYNLGVVYLRKKNLDKAIEYYDKATKLRPENVNALYSLGHCLEEKKNYPASLASFRQAMEIEPTFKDVCFRVGQIYELIEDYPKAIEAFKKSIEVVPGHAPSYLRLGVVQLKAGKSDEARKNLESVLKLNPESDMARQALVELTRIRPQKKPDDKFKGIPRMDVE